ncbi:MAG: hypothetical protein FJ303_22810 [Planctomycetes bacterium]|nr:hypothetical protein [Planctomycetota bacterium]
MLGSIAGGRWHGNVNLNTLTEPEVLQAICDAQNVSQPYYGFTQADIVGPGGLYEKLIRARTNNGAFNLLPTSEGHPFRGFAAGNIADTWFRPDPTNAAQPMFAVGVNTNHPYQRASLLQKVFNNITTTSNVFAIWFTVGYFEVVDETVRPARLGAEIGRAENRHIRHRFFAIVDRSAMKLIDTASSNAVPGTTVAWTRGQTYQVGNIVTYNGGNYVCIQANTNNPPSNGPPAWSPVVMNLPALGTTPSGQPITLQPGMLLEIDSGTASAEVVAVTAAAGNSFMGNFRLNHNANARVVLRGNPGPLNVYNPRRDSEVVLHLSVIQ